MVSDFNELDLMQARVKSIPTDWKFMPVSKAFKIRNEFRKPISDDIRSTQQGIYPYYGPTKIQDYIDTYEQDGSFALIGEDGDHFLKYKNLPMTQLVDGKCTVNNHAHIIEGTELATREWFYYYFMHKDIFSYLSRQGAGRYKLNKASLEKIGLLVPPIEEQKKIAKILSTWDKAIETVEKLVANSQRQKKALMQQLLTGQKRLLDDNGVKFGDEWEVIPIASTFKLITDYVASGSFASLKDNVNVRDDEGFAHYVRQTDLAANFKNTNLKWVDENSYKYLSKSNLYEGDILFTNIGDLGRVYYMPKLEKPATVAPNLVVLRTNEKNNSKFIFYLLESDVGQQEINKIKSGTGLPKISKTEFKTMAFSIPALEEQEKIAQVLMLADREIDLYQQQLDKLKLEKKSLMQQLLTGQKRVKVVA